MLVNVGSGNEYQQASRYIREEKCDNCYMMRRRSCSSNSSSNRSSSDDALYSYTLLAYTHIHWTFISSLLVRSFVRFALSFYKNKKKISEEKKRERAMKGERERKYIRLAAKRERGRAEN